MQHDVTLQHSLCYAEIISMTKLRYAVSKKSSHFLVLFLLGNSPNYALFLWF